MPKLTHRLVILLLALVTAGFGAAGARADDDPGSGVGNGCSQGQCDQGDGFSDGGDGHDDNGHHWGNCDGFSDGGDGFSDGGDIHENNGNHTGHYCHDGFSDGGDGYADGGDPQVPPEGGDDDE